jgi:hypothetical protein
MLLACAFSVAGLVIAYQLPPPEDWTSRDNWYIPTDDLSVTVANATTTTTTTATATATATKRRELRGGGSPSSASDIALYNAWMLTNEGAWALLWTVQGLSILLMMIHLGNLLFMQFERLNVLFRSIKEVTAHDPCHLTPNPSWLPRQRRLANHLVISSHSNTITSHPVPSHLRCSLTTSSSSSRSFSPLTFHTWQMLANDLFVFLAVFLTPHLPYMADAR